MPEFTLADLTAIDTAIKSGVSEVRFQDRLQRFQSTEDMLRVRALIWNALFPASGGGTTRQIRMTTSSGL